MPRSSPNLVGVLLIHFEARFTAPLRTLPTIFRTGDWDLIRLGDSARAGGLVELALPAEVFTFTVPVLRVFIAWPG